MTESNPLYPDLHRLTRRCLADSPRRKRGWVWQNWIPRGTLSLMLGEQGVGKSLLAIELAAMVTRGWTAPPSPELREGKTSIAAVAEAGGQVVGKPGTVIIFGGGDDSSLLDERLEASGADFAHIRVLERIRHDDDDLPGLDGSPPPNGKKPKTQTRAERDRALRLDVRSLQQHILTLKAEGHDVPLVIIDPIEALLRDAIDKPRFAELLSELASKTGAAVVVCGLTEISSRFHFKIKGMETLIQIARTVLTVVEDLEDKLMRLVLPTKLILSATQPGRRFQIRHTSRLDWKEELFHLKPDEYLQQAKEHGKDPLKGETNSELRRVTNWLEERLKDGPALSVDVCMDAQINEMTSATLRRAFKRLGCRTNKQPVTGKWVWRLPGATQPASGGSSASHDAATGGLCASQREAK